MLMTNERRPAIRTHRGWAISVLQEAGAIRECEEHGWMRDRADPHGPGRPGFRGGPPGSTSRSLSERSFRGGARRAGFIGDTCPECPTED